MVGNMARPSLMLTGNVNILLEDKLRLERRCSHQVHSPSAGAKPTGVSSEQVGTLMQRVHVANFRKAQEALEVKLGLGGSSLRAKWTMPAGKPTVYTDQGHGDVVCHNYLHFHVENPMINPGYVGS